MVLEVIGGAFFSAFFQSLFQKMDSQEVKNFIRGKTETDGLLKQLRIELMSVNVVYDDAERKQLSNPVVKQWLHELKEAVLHAEELLGEIKTEATRRKIEAESGSSTSRVQDLISAPFHALNESIDSKIKEILESLSFISKQKDACGLKERGSHRISQSLPSTSLVEGCDVYGRDNDKKAIIELLLSNDVTCNKIGIIPIVGMGGIGKTTLAQLLYNDDEVKRHFELQAWVCVSDEFDIVKITQTIYASVTSQTCDTRDLNELQVKLKDALAGKKFLFVLDDVWNENYNIWDFLRRPFKSGALGSKIIVTARNEGVAATMGSHQTYHLKHLLDEDCWNLFEQHAYKDAGVTVDPNLKVIGRQIVSKCKGLPLAAKSLGGLLRSEPNVKEWENVLKSDIWELSDTRIDILPALWLSYQYLSPVLKRCFAYCSIFSKGQRFYKFDLILLWMAEGLLQPQKKSEMEDVGEKYFNELISRSLFQSSNDCFIMHDLIHDLATYVCGEFCIRLEDHNYSSDIVSKGRHFSYTESSAIGSERFNTIYKAKYLRTFILGDLKSFPTVQLDLLLMLQCLRVLKLRGDDIKELPDSVSNLKHLRYLDLCTTPIQKLPDSICSLCNLQTLLLRECKLLAELPINLGRLINLRHLAFRGTQIKKTPLHVGKLKDLQTLEGEFFLSKDTGGDIAELKGLQHLRGGMLHVSGLQNIKCAKDALQAKLSDKKLSVLILIWEGDTADSQNNGQVLGNLQPNTDLKELGIKGYRGTKFPDWLGYESFSNLVTLRLETCEYCSSLPALGQLPSLKKLEIDGLNGVQSVSPEFYGGVKPAFRSLEVLRFGNMKIWQDWCFPAVEEGGHFPNLCELILDNCPELTVKIPLDSFPGLERQSLKDVDYSQECNKFRMELKLEISDCPHLVCFVGSGELREPKLKEISMSRSKNLWSEEVMQISLPSLYKLKVRDCLEFESFPGESKLQSLYKLEIWECPKFVGFRDGGRLCAPNLTEIDFRGCKNLNSLPAEWDADLRSLQSLSIERCEEFKSFPKSNFPALNVLRIGVCPQFVGFQGGLQAPKLNFMEITECSEFRSLPEEMHKHLPSLGSLFICKCPKLESFPKGGLPSNLRSLTIWSCKKLDADRLRCYLKKHTSLTLDLDEEESDNLIIFGRGAAH